MERHKIKKLHFVSIINNKGLISILGVINSIKNAEVTDLIKNIAVCFSMAVHNKKYLDKTEHIAVTYSLAGLSNRMAYNKAVTKFNETTPDLFSCVYIDVNELHIFNNKFGHAAGDGMLLYIADVLREKFNGKNVFRIGGDEFLIFITNTPKEAVEETIKPDYYRAL